MFYVQRCRFQSLCQNRFLTHNAAAFLLQDPFQSSLQALIATALHVQGGIHAEVARYLVEKALQQNPDCRLGLVLCAQMAADEGKWSETAKVMVNCCMTILVQSKNCYQLRVIFYLSFLNLLYIVD